MSFAELRTYLHEAYDAVKDGSLENQDEVINALFLFLNSHWDQQFPALLYESAIWLFNRYLEHVLPALDYYAREDQQSIAEDYRIFLEALDQSVSRSQQIESAFEQVIGQIRNGTCQHVRDLAESFSEIAQQFFHLQDLKGFQKPFRSDHPFQKHLSALQENFRYEQARAFFKGFLDRLLGDSVSSTISPYRLPISNFKRLFEYVLEICFQGKVVVVDNSRQGQIMPLWVSLDRGKSSAHVEFWNQDIDAAMQASADTARRAARDYLRDEWSQELPEQVFVQCRFPRFEASLKDTSASLCIGISIVGEVLGGENKPATVVTGEVDPSGNIRGVGFINEKIAAASKHEGIERIVIPEANVPEIRTPPPNLPHPFDMAQDRQGGGTTSPPPNLPHQGGGMYAEHPPGPPQGGNKLTVIPVRTFAEAVRQVLDLRREDWGEAPEVFEFYGRQTELQTMQDWMLTDTCRLLVLLGMGGIGKTTLAVKLAKQTVTRGDHTPKPFRHLFWRDLRNAPLCEDILGDCIKFLSEQRELNLPQQTHERISLLLSYLRKHRCLLVFDNIEAIFQGKGGRVGYYREGYENYGELFRRIGAESHISCLLLTSREKPKEIALLEGASVSVRTLQLGGLEQQAGRVLLQEKRLDGTEEQWNTLIDSYGGHPLALQQVAALIQEQFDRHIATFITEFLPQGIPLIDAVQAILEEHYERLSERERQIMYWLAVERGPVSLPELRKDMAAFPLLPRKLPEIMEALTRRALIVKTDEGFTLPPVVMEYLTERFITHIHEDLCFERLSLFNSHALIKAQAKDYIRESQVRLILKPLVEQVLFELNQQGLESQLQDLLARLRANHPRKPGYAGGNTLNLLLHLNDRLNHWDFSNLSVWQAYLQNVDLHDVNFTYSDFSGSMFTETFGGVVSVAFNHDGTLLAAGMTSNEIRFWQTTDYTHLRTCEGHRGWVWSVAFSPDGKTLASGSLDHTVRVWDVATGTCLRTFEGHTGWIWSVAFSPDGHLLASACGDSTVRIWDLRTGNPLTTLQKHTGGVYTVAFSPDGKRLVSGGGDKTVLLWRTEADKILNADTVHHLGEPDTLHTHHNLVRSVAFGPDGHLLVSGSDDKTVCVLHIETGQCLETLGEYTGLVKSVALSADGHILASGSDDATVRLWDLYSKRYLHTLQGHSNWVNHIAFHPDGKMLASGSSDQTVKLWDVRSGYCLKTLQGYSNRVLSVTFSPDSSILAASFSDQTVRLWDVPSGACFKTLRGHTNWVMKGVFSPDGTLLASTSSDTTSRIWDVAAKTCLRVLRGHTQQVRAVAFSPDGKTLITGSDDNTIRLWNLATGETLQVFEERDWILSLSFHSDGSLFASGSQDHTIRVWDAHSGNCLKILEGHALPIWSVRFLPNSDLLVSGSEDQSVRVWDMNTEECLNVLKGHTSRIRSVASSSDGSLLASGSEDTSIRLWDRATGECLRVLSGHSNWVRSVVFSPDDNALASGSEDGTIRLWEIKTGMCQATLQPYRPYERMNITGVTGLTDTQKTTLKELGAIENE